MLIANGLTGSQALFRRRGSLACLLGAFGIITCLLLNSRLAGGHRQPAPFKLLAGALQPRLVEMLVKGHTLACPLVYLGATSAGDIGDQLIIWHVPEPRKIALPFCMSFVLPVLLLGSVRIKRIILGVGIFGGDEQGKMLGRAAVVNTAFPMAHFYLTSLPIHNLAVLPAHNPFANIRRRQVEIVLCQVGQRRRAVIERRDLRRNTL